MNSYDHEAALAKRQATVDAYYTNPSGLVLPEYYRPAGSNVDTVIVSETEPLQPLDNLSEEAIKERLHEIGRNLRLIDYGANSFEIATITAKAETDEYMLHISTYASAISTNSGNAWEFAAQSLRHPDKNHVYVASFGNGGTSPIPRTHGERKYVRDNGRFTKDVDGKVVPIDSIINLNRALAAAGITVTRIMGTDSAGGNTAMALGVAMESGQLSHAFFSERSGFVNLTRREIIGGIALTEQFRNAKDNRLLSHDAGKMTSEKSTEAGRILAQYAETPNQQLLRMRKVGRLAMGLSMRTMMHALRRGPTNTSDPLLVEANAFHTKHSGAHFTYAMADQDPLYKNPEICLSAAKDFLANIAMSRADVRVLILPGMTHGWHTYFPNAYHAVKARALSL